MKRRTTLQLKLLVLIALLGLSKGASAVDCMTSEDCDNPYEYCGTDLVCHHKDIFPLNVSQFFEIVCIFFGVALSNVGGIGGNAIALPVLILLGHYRTSEAIAIGNVIMFFSSATRFIIGCKDKHPFKDKNVVDFNFVMVMMPMGLFGTTLGIFLSQTFPEAVLVILLTGFLILIVYEVYKRTFLLYRRLKRLRRKAEKEIEQHVVDDSEESLPDDDGIRLVSKHVQTDFNPGEGIVNPLEVSAFYSEHKKNANSLKQNISLEFKKRKSFAGDPSKARIIQSQQDEMKKMSTLFAPRSLKEVKDEANKKKAVSTSTKLAKANKKKSEKFYAEDGNFINIDQIERVIPNDQSPKEPMNRQQSTAANTKITNRRFVQRKLTMENLQLMEKQFKEGKRAQTQLYPHYRTRFEQKQLQAIISTQKKICPTKKLWSVWIEFFALVIISLLRTSSKGASLVGIKRCSPIDWFLVGVLMAICIATTLMAAVKVMKEENMKRKLGYPYHATEIKWDKAHIIELSLFSMVTGAFAHALGLGKQLIFGPLMLRHGAIPEVASMTGNFIVMHTSLASTLQFIFKGVVIINQALWLSIFAACGVLTKAFVMNKSFREGGRRQWLILLIIAIAISISAIIMPITSMLELTSVHNQHSKHIWDWTPMCDH